MRKEVRSLMPTHREVLLAKMNRERQRLKYGLVEPEQSDAQDLLAVAMNRYRGDVMVEIEARELQRRLENSKEVDGEK